MEGKNKLLFCGGLNFALYKSKESRVWKLQCVQRISTYLQVYNNYLDICTVLAMMTFCSHTQIG